MHASPRNATVVCQTDVSVLSIGRDDFINIFMHTEGNEEPEFISYLRNIEIFNDWPIAKLPYDKPNICLVNFFRRGVVMCKDSGNNEWIYCVKLGTCRVVKKINLTEAKQCGYSSSYSHFSNDNKTANKKTTDNFIEVKKLNPKDIFVI